MASLTFKHMEPMTCIVIGAPSGGGREDLT